MICQNKFKFVVLKIQLNNPSKNRCYMEAKYAEKLRFRPLNADLRAALEPLAVTVKSPCA